jgi:hypothetical protein
LIFSLLADFNFEEVNGIQLQPQHMMEINARALIRYTAVTGTDTNTDFIEEKKSKIKTKQESLSIIQQTFKYFAMNKI